MFVGNGRSGRKEYWLFHLTALISSLLLVLPIVFSYAGIRLPWLIDDPIRRLSATLHKILFEPPHGLELIFKLFVSFGTLLYLLAIAIASVTLTVRRLHDSDKSALYILFYLLPFFGPIVVFVLMCIPGTQGPNQYGHDPLTSDFDPSTPPNKNRTGRQSLATTKSTEERQDQLTGAAPFSPTHDDHEVVELRRKLAEAEQSSAARRAVEDLQRQRGDTAGSQPVTVEQIEALERIAKLKNMGLLTDEEVQEAKRQFLSHPRQDDIS